MCTSETLAPAGEKHYDLGAKELFKDVCESFEEEKKDKTSGDRAPWVDVAFTEFEKYKGLREIDSPLKEKIHEYFEVSSGKGLKLQFSDPWCGAFIAWSFEKTDYRKSKSKKSAAAFGWTSLNWSKGESCEPFVGAIIVFSWSHVAIIIGENLDGTKYVYLGGNQTGWEGDKSGTQVVSFSSIIKTSNQIKAITKPKDYEIYEKEKKLPKYDVETENDFKSTR